MKRLFAFLLAALLVASSLASCKNNTKNETKSPETYNPIGTDGAETNAPETAAPTPAVPFPTDFLVANGTAMARIVLAEGADPLLSFAADELRYHIETVSMTALAVSSEAADDCLSIVIATPESNPELETLFADDLAWLRDLGEEGSNERWGDDGFAIRRTVDGKIYIFGSNAKGALNGVYDFIEENTGILWVQGTENVGLIYEEQPTVTVKKADYREKSPFSIRGWHLTGGLSEGDGILTMLTRNKMNVGVVPGFTSPDNDWATNIGIKDIEIGHTVKWLIYISPLYDENVGEYWNTNETGEHLNISTSPQINFWSDVTAEAMAASVINFYETYGKAAFIGIEDLDGVGTVYPENTEPYEYAPGEFVYPNEIDYIPTVYYSFINKVAKKVAEVYPELEIPTFAYVFTEAPPRCEIEDNVVIYFAPISEEMNKPIDFEGDGPAASIYKNIEGWKQKTKKMVFYNYYGCFKPSSFYERPVWHKIQGDLAYYADNGFMGLLPEGNANADNWAMNALTYWIYSKLCWNPYEDVDALIKEFCDKCYGDASEAMQEYYRLVKAGWDEGSIYLADEFNAHLKWNSLSLIYWDNFIDNPGFEENAGLLDKIRAALDTAWEAADDSAKERIRHIRDCYAKDDLFFE